MKVLILYEGMVHRGLAAASRCLAYGQILRENDITAKILVPFSFKARKEMPAASGGYLTNVAFEYVSYIPYHPKDRHSFLYAGILLYYSKMKGYSKLLLRLLFNRSEYDVVFIYEFSIFYSLLIRIFSWGKPLVFEICEIPFFDIKDDKIRFRKRKLRENWNYKLADGFITISNSLTKYVYNVVGRKKISLVQIPILSSVNDTPLKSEGFDFQKFEPYVVHTGTLTETKDGFLSILNGIGELKKIYSKQINLICTGDINNSPVKNEANEIIEYYILTDCIHFTGYLNDKELNLLIKNALLSIIYKIPNEQNEHCFPTKIARYLASGVPLIVTNIGQLKFEFENDENAIVIDAGDVNQLALAIKELMEDDNKRILIGKRGVELFRRRFSLTANSKPLVSFYKEFIRN